MATPADENPTAPAGFKHADLPRIMGRYVLLRRLARGGMGEVYLASTTGLEGAERPVVVKVIRREHIGDQSFLARFLDEARVQAQLSHTGVAQVLDAATDEATAEPYVVVEYVDGRSLADVRARCVQTGAKVAWPEAVAVAILVAEALDYVHDRRDAMGRPLGIVHRDLSPQNVMLSYDGDVKLIDFGTARGQNRRCHTVAGVVFAKPGYVAPEVAGGDPGDGRVDLYALGIMLWEMCAGRRFLQGDAQDHLAAVTRGEKNPPAIAESAGAPALLDEVIASLTRVDREERLRVGSEAARALAKVLAAAPPLDSDDRGVRARARELMTRLFRDEPARARRAFARLLESSRSIVSATKTPVSPRSAAVATAMAAQEEGMLPGTRYRIRREIGRGASSAVYEAEHADLGFVVALKVLSPERGSSADYADRFRREAQVLSKLSHEHLVSIRDFGQTSDGRLFCVMELCEGTTLDKEIATRGGVSTRRALEIAKQTLLALSVAHAEGLVHRDVKPANIMVSPDGALKLLDFGLVMSAEDVRETPPSTLSSMTLFGTPDYMAPEQASGAKVDERADIYAVGCILYELLTGTMPFERESAVAVLEAKIKGSPEHPRTRAPERSIRESLDELVMRAIARHPSLRFGSAEEMIAAIEGELGAAQRRVRGWLGAGAAALAVVGAIAAWGLHVGEAGVRERVAQVRHGLDGIGASAESPGAVAEVPPPALAEPAEPIAEEVGDASSPSPALAAPITASMQPEAEGEADAHPTSEIGEPSEEVAPRADDPAERADQADDEREADADEPAAVPSQPSKPASSHKKKTAQAAKKSDAPRAGRVAKKPKAASSK